MDKIQKLTSWEWEALVSNSNLADGHAHQSQNARQEKIINDLPNIYRRSDVKSQDEFQAAFEKQFFARAGQHSYKQLLPPQYHYACSISIEIVANYLRLTNKSLSLIHPTFDNLADIFRRHKINLTALEESDLVSTSKLELITTDALMIVCPNNPTGQELTEEQFINIINICKQKKILLIIDYSFRLYSTFKSWDQYEVLLSSGIDFIVIEDTGKTLPTMDLKLGILLSSNSIYYALKDITNDFLLNVSPFVFALLTEYLKAENNKKAFSFQDTITKNKKKLIKAFANSCFEVENKDSNISVAWIKIPDERKSRDLCAWLETKGIFVLPGTPFFWNNSEKGDSYFRVALARPLGFFNTTITRLAKECEEYLTGPIV